MIWFLSMQECAGWRSGMQMSRVELHSIILNCDFGRWRDCNKPRGWFLRHSLWDLCGCLLKQTALHIKQSLYMGHLSLHITSKTHTHPSHLQTSRLLTSSLSLGVPVPRGTQCRRVVKISQFLVFHHTDTHMKVLSLSLNFSIHNKQSLSKWHVRVIR